MVAFSARACGSAGASSKARRRARGRDVEVLRGQREGGEFLVALQVGAVLVDEDAVLVDRARDVAAIAQQAGIGQPRLAMRAIEAEDVAELDRRALGFALGEQRDRALIVLLGALDLAVAGGEPERDEEEQDGGEGAEGHEGLRRQGTTRPAGAGRDW